MYVCTGIHSSGSRFGLSSTTIHISIYVGLVRSPALSTQRSQSDSNETEDGQGPLRTNWGGAQATSWCWTRCEFDFWWNSLIFALFRLFFFFETTNNFVLLCLYVFNRHIWKTVSEQASPVNWKRLNALLFSNRPADCGWFENLKVCTYFSQSIAISEDIAFVSTSPAAQYVRGGSICWLVWWSSSISTLLTELIIQVHHICFSWTTLVSRYCQEPVIR